MRIGGPGGGFILAVLAPPCAFAATQGVLFNATVDATCTLTVNSNGTMSPSVDLQTLSSHVGSGTAGSVALATTGGVSISVDPVTVVTVPPADLTPTDWTPTYAVSGTHSIAETEEATALTAPGSSTVSVHLAGTKGGTDRFVNGTYQATVTVRCE